MTATCRYRQDGEEPHDDRASNRDAFVTFPVLLGAVAFQTLAPTGAALDNRPAARLAFPKLPGIGLRVSLRPPQPQAAGTNVLSSQATKTLTAQVPWSRSSGVATSPPETPASRRPRPYCGLTDALLRRVAIPSSAAPHLTARLFGLLRRPTYTLRGSLRPPQPTAASASIFPGQVANPLIARSPLNG